MESRLWNKLEYVTPGAIAAIWKARKEIELNGTGIFAAIANEFANGSIVHRPWAAVLETPALLEVLRIGLINLGYIRMRAIKAGIDQRPILRTYAYLILAALDRLPAEKVYQLIADSITRGQREEMRAEVHEFLLLPIMDVLLSEMQDVCSSDCKRVYGDHNFLKEDEIDDYWLRLEEPTLEEPAQRQILRIESFKEPCVVGYPVNEKVHCPLFSEEPTIENTSELLAVVKRVAAFRKKQASEKRETEIRRKTKLTSAKARPSSERDRTAG